MDNGASSYRRFLDGDDDGLIQIIKEYKDGLIIYLNGFVFDMSISEELAEDTFVKLIIKKPSFKGRSSFKTWLYSVAGNLARDYLKKKSRQKIVSIDEAFKEASEEDVPLEYLRSGRRKMLFDAMKRLKPEYYQVLSLVYFEDFSNSDTAKIMKKSRRQIENLLYRSRLALKKELEKEGFIYEEL